MEENKKGPYLMLVIVFYIALVLLLRLLDFLNISSLISNYRILLFFILILLFSLQIILYVTEQKYSRKVQNIFFILGIILFFSIIFSILYLFIIKNFEYNNYKYSIILSYSFLLSLSFSLILPRTISQNLS